MRSHESSAAIKYECDNFHHILNIPDYFCFKINEIANEFDRHLVKTMPTFQLLNVSTHFTLNTYNYSERDQTHTQTHKFLLLQKIA